MNSYKEITLNGLWHNNPALTQLLGLCPLLAVTLTFINGLGMGIATTITLVFSNVIVSLIRNWVRKEVRIPVFVLVIASVVTIIELLMQAYMLDLYKKLGIFISLIVTNCVIIGRAEAFASKNSVSKSFVDGLMMGLGFTIILLILGSMREIIGAGTLFSNAHLMFGEKLIFGFSEANSLFVTYPKEWMISFGESYQGFLLAVLPPGAFLGLGLILAIKNVIDNRAKEKALQTQVDSVPNIQQAT